MKVIKVGDWGLEDRLVLGGPPLVVLFMIEGDLTSDLRRADFRRVASERPDAKFLEVDVSENPSVVQEYSIRSIPEVIVFLVGHEVARHTKGSLSTTIDRVLGRLIDGD